MSHVGVHWIPESTSHMHTHVPTVLDFPFPQRAEGSIAISNVNILHSLYFAHCPRGISHCIWGQRWPTGKVVGTASPAQTSRQWWQKLQWAEEWAPVSALSVLEPACLKGPNMILSSSLGIGPGDAGVAQWTSFSLGTESCHVLCKIKLQGDQPCRSLQPILTIPFVWKGSVASVQGTPLWAISCQLYKWTIKQSRLQSHLSSGLFTQLWQWGRPLSGPRLQLHSFQGLSTLWEHVEAVLL